MAVGEMVNLSTWQGRLRAARIDAGYGGPALSALMGRNKNWSRDIETGHGSPDPETLAELARVLGRSVQWIVTGEESGRTEFVDALAGLEPALDSAGRRTVVAIARQQVEESQARAITLSDEEAELVRLLRTVAGQQRRELLASMTALARGSSRLGAPSGTAPEVDPLESRRSQERPT